MKRITLLSTIAAFSLGLFIACGGTVEETETATQEVVDAVEETVEAADSTMEAVADSVANDSTTTE